VTGWAGEAMGATMPQPDATVPAVWLRNDLDPDTCGGAGVEIRSMASRVVMDDAPLQAIRRGRCRAAYRPCTPRATSMSRRIWRIRSRAMS
jgi:hypothetical protein